MLSIKKLLTKILQWLNTPLVATRDVTNTVSVPANTNAACIFTVPSISGYTYIGILGIENSHGAHFVITDFSARYHRAVIRNLTATTTTITLTARLLYIRGRVS